jgi:hypothetical protein
MPRHLAAGCGESLWGSEVVGNVPAVSLVWSSWWELELFPSLVFQGY